MNAEQINNPSAGVPKQVFEQFLKTLEKEAVPPDVIARLKKVLIDQGDISDIAIKKALFPDNNTAV